MKFLLGRAFFVGVALAVLLFAFSNKSTIALKFWPFMGSLHAPLFAVVLVVFVVAFFAGVAYSRLKK